MALGCLHGDPRALENYQGFSATDAYGVAEPATVPTAPAIANAIDNAIGVPLRALPMNRAAPSCARPARDEETLSCCLGARSTTGSWRPPASQRLGRTPLIGSVDLARRRDPALLAFGARPIGRSR